jgi:hypothetical protein
MAVTKLDISLAARAAGHLYLTTGIVAAGIFGALAAWITYPFRRQVGHLSLMTDTVTLTFLSIGFLSALYYARRELNGWAYVIATPWPVLLVAALGATYFDSLSKLEKIEIDDVIDNVPKLGLALFITIYLVRVLIDYSRLALSGHNASSVPPLRLANEVSKLLRYRRSLLPWIHMPTNPRRTFVYAILFLSFVGLIIYRMYLGRVYKNVSSEIWVFENFGGALLLIAYVGAAAMAGLVRRHYVVRAARVLELDNRRPILFLRSFADDKVRLWGKGIYGKFRRRNN